MNAQPGIVIADRAELLGVLEENRAKHRHVFEESLRGYETRLMRELEDRVNTLKAGRLPDPVIHLTEPKDHTADYDRVIRMVQMHQGDTFPLDESQFSCYVMDQWRWRQQWDDTSNVYAAAAYTRTYGES